MLLAGFANNFLDEFTRFSLVTFGSSWLRTFYFSCCFRFLMIAFDWLVCLRLFLVVTFWTFIYCFRYVICYTSGSIRLRGVCLKYFTWLHFWCGFLEFYWFDVLVWKGQKMTWVVFVFELGLLFIFTVVSFVVSVVSFCFFVLRLSFIWTVLSFYFALYCLLFYAEFGVTFSFLVVLFSRFKCSSGFLGFCC